MFLPALMYSFAFFWSDIDLANHVTYLPIGPVVFLLLLVLCERDSEEERDIPFYVLILVMSQYQVIFSSGRILSCSMG